MLAATDAALLVEQMHRLTDAKFGGGCFHSLSIDSFTDRGGQQWLIATFKPLGGGAR